MTTKTLILIIVNFSASLAFGQTPQVKKETKITYFYNYDSLANGEMYLGRNGHVKIDTTVKEFNLDGKLKEEYYQPNSITDNIRTINLDSVVIISSSKVFLHQREYWSDTTAIDVYTQNFGDSIIQTKVIINDTIQINKSYYDNGKLVKSHNRDFRIRYYKFDEIINYLKKNKNREIATIITTHSENSLPDTIKIDNNHKRKYKKIFEFNKNKNEWFLSSKRQFLKRAKIEIELETFYHNYHQKYFTTRTTTVHNESGQRISQIQYDTYLKKVKLKTIYKYEYY